MVTGPGRSSTSRMRKVASLRPQVLGLDAHVLPYAGCTSEMHRAQSAYPGSGHPSSRLSRSKFIESSGALSRMSSVCSFARAAFLPSARPPNSSRTYRA